MFLPAEAIFAEINAYHTSLVKYAANKKVWITSPTTLMSLLTIIQSVLSILITGGAALAIVGGIVNHVKGKNRAKKLKRRSIAEEYGGNGVEF